MKAVRNSNRLIHEKSPYLLQHAHNPVDWYPWGEEAFKKAEEEDKPIFLSIGYSTCHWCHVMEKESFEDPDVAKFLNEHYVAIKVDREERADIDSIYMTYCQMITGNGGWPLSVFLMPNKKPFYAGTYFPKERRYGVIGFLELLQAIEKKWRTSKEAIIDASENSLRILKAVEAHEEELLQDKKFDEAYNYFVENFDEQYGGFGIKPKFPAPHQLMFLLRFYKQTKEDYALEMVEKSIEGMYKGGIFDHVGFGFCRYSTDQKWLVPHFEKMLYDNALMIILLSEVFQITKKDLYRELIDRVSTYILREMTDEEGGFYSAQDADTDGEEGKYYLWSKQEIEEVLGPEDGPIYINYYNITEEGNFEGYNIPNLIGVYMDELRDDKGLNSRLYEMNKMLLMHREKRVRPPKDDKILSSWNGLMIAAMAIAGRTLEDCQLVECGKRAYWFLDGKLKNEAGEFYARYREGEARFNAFLTSYANIAWGLLELYESSFNINFLEDAIETTEKMIDLFWDEQKGGFFLYAKNSEEMIIRPKEVYDGALPSGNSVACYVLLRLARLLHEERYEEYARRVLSAFGAELNNVPQAHTFLLSAKMYADLPTSRYIISGFKCDEECQRMVKAVHQSFTPFGILMVNDHDDVRNQIPYLKDYMSEDGVTTGYICEEFSCKAPVNSGEAFENLVQGLTR